MIADYPQEFLQSLNFTGLPLHELRLKEGAIVMLLRNLNIKEGLCNGTRLKILKFLNYSIKVEILTGKFRKNEVLIPRIKLASNTTRLPFKMMRLQLTIIPAFAMTVNKSQGQSFKKVGIYLDNAVFTHGQLYVALSRTTNKEGLKIEIKETPEQGHLLNYNRVLTKNIVF
jgi:ATP-dependent DNA helicase PIF1